MKTILYIITRKAFWGWVAMMILVVAPVVTVPWLAPFAFIYGLVVGSICNFYMLYNGWYDKHYSEDDEL